MLAEVSTDLGTVTHQAPSDAFVQRDCGDAREAGEVDVVRKHLGAVPPCHRGDHAVHHPARGDPRRDGIDDRCVRRRRSCTQA